MSHLPLDQFTSEVFASLGHALWSWTACKECSDTEASKPLTHCKCPVARSERYFRFYQTVVLDYFASAGKPIFRIHDDLFKAIACLRNNSKLTRNELCKCIAPSCSDSDELASSTALVARVLLMLECSTIYQSADRLEKGFSNFPWNDNTSIASYVSNAFSGQLTVTPHSLIWDSDLRHGYKSTLRATKLQKRLKLRLRPTHDLRNHLRIDRQRGELEIFHHASFLKEQLWASSPSASRRSHANEGNGTNSPLLPRQLLLEILNSLQRVLFPLDDPASKRLLRRLITSPDTDFDPSLLQFECSSLFGWSTSAQDNNSPITAYECKNEDNDCNEAREHDFNIHDNMSRGEDGGGGSCVRYQYLASRLVELREELENPPPRRWFDRQLQRRSSGRYVMMVTLAGVVFAVLSLIMSAIQTWIAYQAWKRPYDPSPP